LRRRLFPIAAPAVHDHHPRVAEQESDPKDQEQNQQSDHVEQEAHERSSPSGKVV